MAKSALITMTLVGLDIGPTLNLYSDVDGYTTPFETGVLKVDLEVGYTSSLVPDAAIRIRAYSIGVCTNYAQCSIAVAHSLAYSATSCEEACSSTPVIYYSQCSELVLFYCYLWTNPSLTSAFEAPAGFYSDGVNCYDYRFPHTGFIAITSCPPPSDAVLAFDFYNDGSGNIRARATVTSGTTLDILTFTGSVNGYQSIGCSGTLIVQPSLSVPLSAGSSGGSLQVFPSASAIVSAQYDPLIVNGNTITMSYQNITVGGHTYTITGATNCYSPL